MTRRHRKRQVHHLEPAGAVIAGGGRYLYRLWRSWEKAPGGTEGTCLWVMLNPSTADHVQDDPTIRRVVGYSKAWGFTRAEVVNLYAYRTASPADLCAVTAALLKAPGIGPGT